jgi:hypothetical protein
MGSSHLRVDLVVIAQGIRLAMEFGWRPLEEMALVAELLEHSVYRHGSLRSEGDRWSFELLNPPLRMGAFSRLELFLDGARVPPEAVEVAVPPAAARRLDTIDPEHPFELPVGRRSGFTVRTPPPARGTHRVRLELVSVAIPPTVLFEFTDHLQEARGP